LPLLIALGLGHHGYFCFFLNLPTRFAAPVLLPRPPG
jgi:hypothetical protein